MRRCDFKSMYSIIVICNYVWNCYICSQLLSMTCQIANVLKSKGVHKGDSVLIYMPAMPLVIASMLACARIGAVHW